ncbi:MAG: restriction endonuclease subunit S [Lentisphaeria bacterium]|jgi:type I restriction enzyme S subunit
MKWRKIRIGSLCRKATTRDPRQQPDTPFRYIDISSIDREQKLIASSTEIIGVEAPGRARQVVLAGDVLVSTVRPNLNAVAMVPPELEGEIASTGFCVLRAVENLILPKFLFYFTRTDTFINALLQHVRGANYPAVTDRNVLSVEIPWPTLTEQRQIVEILDQADALRQQRRAADEKIQRILPALFYRMFGDPLENPLGFPIEPVGDLLVLLRNGTTAEQNQVGRGYPVTRIETISAGVIAPERVRYVELSETDVAKWRLERGDILFSHINSESHIGKTAIYQGCPSPLIHGMNLLLMRPDKRKVRPEFLFAVLNSPSVRDAYRQRSKRAVNQASLNQKDISELMVAVPALDEQERFCVCAEKLLTQLEVQRHTRDKVISLYDNLLHRAFTGELTAKWREAHREEVEAEMQAQAKVLAGPVARPASRGGKRGNP